MEAIGIIILCIGALYLVNRMFYYLQKSTGVRLTQNYSQAKDLRNLENYQAVSLNEEPPELVELAKKQCKRKGFAMTVSNISTELEDIKKKQNITESSEEKIFSEILKEAEIRAGSNWWSSADPMEVSKYVSEIKRERYPREKYPIKYYSLKTSLPNSTISEIERGVLKKFGLEGIEIKYGNYQKVKDEIIRIIKQFE
jgi:hypothetical protein